MNPYRTAQPLSTCYVRLSCSACSPTRLYWALRSETASSTNSSPSLSYWPWPTDSERDSYRFFRRYELPIWSQALAWSRAFWCCPCNRRRSWWRWLSCRRFVWSHTYLWFVNSWGTGFSRPASGWGRFENFRWGRIFLSLRSRCRRRAVHLSGFALWLGLVRLFEAFSSMQTLEVKLYFNQ